VPSLNCSVCFQVHSFPIPGEVMNNDSRSSNCALLPSLDSFERVSVASRRETVETLQLSNSRLSNSVHPYLRVGYEGRSCDGSVGTLAGYELDGQGSITGQSLRVPCPQFYCSATRPRHPVARADVTASKKGKARTNERPLPFSVEAGLSIHSKRILHK
jgi:hypothetical protein